MEPMEPVLTTPLILRLMDKCNPNTYMFMVILLKLVSKWVSTKNSQLTEISYLAYSKHSGNGGKSGENETKF